MPTLNQLREESRWLLRHSANVTSECGEDGILSAALDLLPARNRWCIEFGAWDGHRASNTYNLITSRGYRGVLVEADASRFRELQRTHSEEKNILLNAAVGFEESDSLDALLRAHPVPEDVDVLSIDIDGNDYHAWAAIRRFRPKLVVIEFNPTIANAVRFVQEKRAGVTQGASAAALAELGQAKGYELIAATNWNLIFVDSRHYPAFHIPDNSVELMRDDSGCPHIFSGYDGKVFLSAHGNIGSMPLPWHAGLSLDQFTVQALPKFLRCFPANYSGAHRIAYNFYVHLLSLRRRIRGNIVRLSR